MENDTKVSIAEKAKSGFGRFWNDFIHFYWVTRLLSWTITSAGTMAEGVFLIASLWMSINSTVHPFVRLAFSEDQTVHFSELANVAYVALPECILFLALLTTFNRLKTALYVGKLWSMTWIWFVAYALPTIIFVTLSAYTLSNSMASVHFTLPQWLAITRGLAGYYYAILSFLYVQLGKPDERERLVEKDRMIAALRQDNLVNLASLTKQKDELIAGLHQENFALTSKIDGLINELLEVKNEKTSLIKSLNHSNEMALQAYSEECQNWLNSGSKSATIEVIMQYTGHSKAKIKSAMDRGILKKAPNSEKDLILLSSLIPWLKSNVPSDTGSRLHLVNA